MEEKFSLKNQDPIQYENTLQRIAVSMESIDKNLKQLNQILFSALGGRQVLESKSEES